MKKRLSPTMILVGIGLIALAAAVVAYWFVYTRVASQVASTQAALTDMITERNQASQDKTIVSLLASTVADRAHLSDAFIQGDQLVNFIERFEAIGADLSSIQTDDLSVAPKGTVGHIHAHVDGQGSWSQVMKLLLLTEKLPYSIAIDHLQLSARSVDPKKRSALWGISFDVDVLSLK